MKKYLVTGLAAVAISGMFTSCTHDNDSVGGSSDLGVVETYEKAFISRFGTPSPDADWGFGPSTTQASTRALGDYDDYKGNLEPVNVSFPEDANASNFDPDLTGIPSYNDYCKTLGNQWSTPDEFGYGEVYIDKVQKIHIWGEYGKRAKLYIKEGTYDFTNETFDLCADADLYLLSGATVTLNNTAANTAKFDVYIAPGAKLIANGENGYRADVDAHVFNHGTIECTRFEVNGTSFLYNVGTLTSTGDVYIANSTSRIVNDGTINSASTNVEGSGALQNNAEWNVSGNTIVSCTSGGWVNNGHWTTLNYGYTAGSENVINNCFLEVTNEFDMNISSSNPNASFKIDTGGGVLTKYFNGGKVITDATSVSGPYKIVMGQASVFKVTETATLDGGNRGWGFFGPSEGQYAVFQAKDVRRGREHSQGMVTYGGNLYVSAETHFTNDDQNNPSIYYDAPFTLANIYASGDDTNFSKGAPSITIDQTPCNPGFEGQETEPTEVRVICEDLFANSGSDFDFNDLVFDVVFGDNAKIIIRAAGGTLPIYINGGTEIHELMGNDTPDEKGLLPMLNTGAAAKGLYGVDNVAAKEINLGFAINKRKEIPENITIKVVKDGTEYTLQNNKEAATMICVGTDFEPWMGERDQLKLAYPKFVDFVQTGKPAWNKWYK